VSKKLWRQYLQLTEVESVFRTRIQRRVEAHILVAFLGYCLLVGLKQKLKVSAAGLINAGASAPSTQTDSLG
jgi:hypothetical protein